MIKNYFNIAWRNIVRHKIYTAINVAGLALGICSCIVIYLVSSYEFSFDAFHPDKHRIYRVMADVTENTGREVLHFGKLPFGVSTNGRSEITGLDAIAGVIPYNSQISVPDNNNPVKHFDSRPAGAPFVTTVIAQPQYFTIFKYQWLTGNPSTALDAPLKVVLTESKARQYFGNVPLDEIIGRQVIYGDSLEE